MRINYQKDFQQQLPSDVKLFSINEQLNNSLSRTLINSKNNNIAFSMDKISSVNQQQIDQKQATYQVNNSLSNNNGKKKQLFHLRKLITKHKVKILTQNFVNKLRQTNTHRKPPQNENLINQKSNINLSIYQNFLKYLQTSKGIKLSSIALTLWSLINIIHMTLIVFIFSIMIAFKQTQSYEIFVKYRFYSIGFFIIDMILNFITQRYQTGKQIINLRQIGRFYITNGLFIDLLNLIMFPIELMINSYQNNALIFLMFLSLSKLWNSIKKFQKFDYLYIKTTQKQHYYALIKVFITNFFIGHILSIVLNKIATINPQQNWYDIINISQAHWSIRYVWGYYWGTNMMLTVGFGDIRASTYIEAIFIIFIQTFSCITLAYNIGTVGSLMSQLKSKDQKKKKQMKIFHRMSQENQINNQLTTRISNFIEQSFQIRESFQFQEQDNLLESLPKGLHSQFRIQANKILFDKVGILNNMSSRTLINLAQNIQRKISHPQEIIKKKGTSSCFIILRNGQVGFCCRRHHSILNGKVIESLNVSKNEKSKLLSLDFIKGHTYDFDIKSLSYSIIYFLQRDKFMNCLKDFQLDYQYFCTMKDGDQHLSNQHELYKCDVCKNLYHNRFKCNKLHFIPIKQHIIRKRIQKQPKCQRQKINRPSRKLQNYRYPLLTMKQLKVQYQKFIHQNFGKNYVQKLNMSKKYFQKAIKFREIQTQRLKNIGKFTMKQIDKSDSKYFKQDNMGTNRALSIKQLSVNNNYELFQKLIKTRIDQTTDLKGFWDVQSDIIFNFKYYFTNFNAQNLCNNGKLKKDKFFGIL